MGTVISSKESAGRDPKKAWEIERQRFLAVWDQQAVSEADTRHQVSVEVWRDTERIWGRVEPELSSNAEWAGQGSKA